jgi:hypothetical protein
LTFSEQGAGMNSEEKSGRQQDYQEVTHEKYFNYSVYYNSFCQAGIWG